MFTKLLKHNLRSQAGVFAVLSLAAIGCGLLGGLMISLLRGATEGNSDLMAIITLFSGMFTMFSMLAIFAYAVGITVMLYLRFYKRLFSDEGYLTFTLPVNVHQLLLSEIVNIAIWSVLSVIVLLISWGLIFSSVFRDIDFDFSMIFNEFGGLMEGTLWIQIISAISTFAYGLMLPTFSIVLGAQVAKKHKLLAAFGIGYGLNMALSIVSGFMSIFSLAADVTIYDGSDLSTMMIFSTLIPALLQLAVAVGGYFIMHHLLGKNLNLT